MPIRSKPVTYSCAKCGWKKTVWPKSDALRPGGPAGPGRREAENGTATSTGAVR